MQLPRLFHFHDAVLMHRVQHCRWLRCCHSGLSGPYYFNCYISYDLVIPMLIYSYTAQTMYKSTMVPWPINWKHTQINNKRLDVYTYTWVLLITVGLGFIASMLCQDDQLCSECTTYARVYWATYPNFELWRPNNMYSCSFFTFEITVNLQRQPFLFISWYVKFNGPACFRPKIWCTLLDRKI